jgi:hypothetical protein
LPDLTTTRTPASSVATTSTPLLLFFLLSCKYKNYSSDATAREEEGAMKM